MMSQVQIDPQLIFQTLSLIATNGSCEDPPSRFKYELCTHPAAFFDHSSLLWEANKPALADALWKLVDNDYEVLSYPVHDVLDGGSLLHHLPWTQGEAFESVCIRYVKYVTKKWEVYSGFRWVQQWSRYQRYYAGGAAMEQDQLWLFLSKQLSV